MPKRLLDRYYLVLASIYLYNEYRGYSELERLLAAIKQTFPSETDFIAAVTKHTEDERKHYLMFRHYFESRSELPLAIERSNGYVDRFIKLIFRKTTDELDTAAITGNEQLFFKLCRLVMMTEFRGMKQVDALLRSRAIQRNDELLRIFRIVERDEPTHCYPYQQWLRTKGSHEPALRERITDWWIHYSLVFIKFPVLYLNPFIKRLDASTAIHRQNASRLPEPDPSYPSHSFLQVFSENQIAREPSTVASEFQQ